MEILNHPIIGQVVSICVAAICGWLGARVAGLRKRDEALYAGMRVLLRAQLFDAYEAYVTGGQALSYERKEEVSEAYRAYAALGGNGVISTMHEALMAVPVETVR